MTSSNQGKTFLKEFKDFLTFLKNLWGMLAGISVLFPLSNMLVRLIPLETYENKGALVWLSSALFTTLATLGSLFLILLMFSQRQKFQSTKISPRIQRQAWVSFVIGLGLLIIYLIIYFLLGNAYSIFGWSSDDIRRLIGEVPLIILYGFFFAFITRAFMLIGMSEYFRRKK